MDNYELATGEKIYPISKVNIDKKNFLFYTMKEKDITADDIYVGEESGDELLPVSEELLPSLKQTIEEIFDMIISNQNQE